MAAASPVIALLSDFGTRGHYVGAMKGVLASLAPHATLIDITHDVPHFDVDEGAQTLQLAAREFPAGTVFLAVVDPGVGGQRQAIAARTRDGAWFVGPDNGLLWPAVDERGQDGAWTLARVRPLSGGEVSATFHGRDLFAPAAAHLARGESPALLGDAIQDLVRLEIAATRRDGDALESRVRRVDAFGNVITGITRAELAGIGASPGSGSVRVELAGGALMLELPLHRCYDEVAPGEALALIDSSGWLELAIDQASFADAHTVAPGESVRVTWTGRS